MVVVLERGVRTMDGIETEFGVPGVANLGPSRGEVGGSGGGVNAGVYIQ
jgi:hypothetical protein